MKNIKKMLAQHKSEILPDDKIKDNIKRELGMQQTEQSLAYAHGGEKTVDNRRKNGLIVLCAAMLAFAILLGALIPTLMNPGSSPLVPSFENKFENITDANSFYAYGVASVGTLLASANAQSRDTGATTASEDPIAHSQSLTEDQLATINRYMTLVESLLSDGKIENSEIGGDMGYECGMSVKYTDLCGGDVSYRMFYNKTFLDGEVDGDEKKNNYSIDGILLIDGNRYSVEGLYKTETEDDEFESELYFKAYTNAEKTSYIEVERESENESGEDAEIEQKYVYSAYDGGKLVERTVIEYEAEKDEIELKLSIARDGKKETLIFNEEVESGERVLSVRGDMGGNNVNFRVYIRQNTYHYVFEDGTSSDLERDEDDEDDEDDDDEEDDD